MSSPTSPPSAAGLSQQEARLHALALAEWQAGRLPRALELFVQLATLNGTRALYLRQLGELFFQMRQPEPAVTALQLATRLDPADAAGWHFLGVALYGAGRWEEAAAASLEAVRRAPQNADAFQNLGLALGALRDFAKAAEMLGEAVRLAPASFAAWYNLGNQLLAENRTAEAATAYRRAIALQPDRAEPHINLALALLTQGDLEAGWVEFEWRWQGEHLGGDLRQRALPRWDGGAAPRTILLAAEQGLGDTLQFCRYAPLVAARGHRVVLEVQPELTTLLAYSVGTEAVEVVSRAAQGPDPARLPPSDAVCAMMSLPGVFGTTLETIPGEPYLRAEPERIAAWQRRLVGAAGKRLRVGLVWAGNPENRHRQVDTWRSMPFAALAPLFEIEGIAFVSLQKGAAAAQLREADAPCIDAGPTLGDFSDTAALVACLDLVITVDTAAAHLAGGMGKPVWMLSRYNGCWRWLAERSDSPWYPSMRIFRQDARRCWSPAVEEVRKALAAESAAQPARS